MIQNDARLNEVKRLNKRIVDEINQKEKQFEETLAVNDLVLKRPKKIVNVNKIKDKDDNLIPLLLFSDEHCGEVVNKKQTNNLNEYNLDLFKKRNKNILSNFFNTIENIKNVDKNKMVYCIGGDSISGELHTEHRLYNEKTNMQLIMEYINQTEENILQLKKYGFKNIFIPCVTGNHDRTGVKKLTKNTMENSFSYIIYTMLQKIFKNDNNIIFKVSDNEDNIFKIYNTTFLLTHGDQFRGGSTEFGLTNMLVKAYERKRKLYLNQNILIDTILLGHFHKFSNIDNSKIIVNGSLKGYDEYTMKIGYDFQQPGQTMLLVGKKGIEVVKFLEAEKTIIKEAKWIEQ